MIRMLFLLIGLLLATPVAAKECYIITSSLSNFLHEKAHCNGWEHPFLEGGWNPPTKYLGTFDGTLHVTVVDGGDPDVIRAHAQPGTTFSVSPLHAPEVCMFLWDSYNVYYGMDSRLINLIGCSLMTDQKGWTLP